MTRLVVLVVCGTFLLVAANAQEPGDDVASLIAQLKGKDPRARAQAAKTLGSRGGERAIAALGDALGDDPESVRHEAAIALARLAPDNPKVVEVLIESLKNEDWYARWQACLALRALGPRAERAVPVLIDVLCDARLDVCREATLALTAIAPKKREVVDVLLGLLEAQDAVDWRAVIFALNRSGEIGRAIPWLAREVHTNQHGFRDSAEQLLDRITHRHAKSFLELFSPEEGLRVRAAGRIRGALRELAIPALREALKDDSWRVRRAVLDALGKMERRAKPAVPDIVRKLASSDGVVRDAAYIALEAIVPSLASVIEVNREYGVPAGTVRLVTTNPQNGLLALLMDPTVGDATLSALAQVTKRTEEDLLKQVRAQAAKESGPNPRAD